MTRLRLTDLASGKYYGGVANSSERMERQHADLMLRLRIIAVRGHASLSFNRYFFAPD